ncbi:MAG: hypothetical protein EBX35_14160 [Planctomycetia bacterium]|nr:hypothetical protein [Planctomycetia bacterium]
MELLTDNLARCREAVQLVEPAAITIEAGHELLVAITAAADLEAPCLADVLQIVRERAIDPAADGAEPEKVLLVSLMKASTGNRGGYALGVDRHAREIRPRGGGGRKRPRSECGGDRGRGGRRGGGIRERADGAAGVGTVPRAVPPGARGHVRDRDRGAALHGPGLRRVPDAGQRGRDDRQPAADRVVERLAGTSDLVAGHSGRLGHHEKPRHGRRARVHPSAAG